MWKHLAGLWLNINSEWLAPQSQFVIRKHYKTAYKKDYSIIIDYEYLYGIIMEIKLFFNNKKLWIVGTKDDETNMK